MRDGEWQLEGIGGELKFFRDIYSVNAKNPSRHEERGDNDLESDRCPLKLHALLALGSGSALSKSPYRD